MTSQEKKLAYNLGEKLAFVTHPRHLNEPLERAYRAQTAHLEVAHPGGALVEVQRGYVAECKRLAACGY